MLRIFAVIDIVKLEDALGRVERQNCVCFIIADRKVASIYGEVRDVCLRVGYKLILAGGNKK